MAVAEPLCDDCGLIVCICPLDPPSDICPWEALLPSGSIPCTYLRGHDGRHSYITHDAA